MENGKLGRIVHWSGHECPCPKSGFTCSVIHWAKDVVAIDLLDQFAYRRRGFHDNTVAPEA